MLSPKRVKFRKQHRGRRRGLSRGQLKVQFGEYGLKALDEGWLTNRQIEAARIAMTRKIKRGGKVWINVYPDKPFTKKPAETRMGSGKGSPEGWVAVVKPGRVMFELAGVPEPLAREAMRLAGHKLPVKTKFVMREDLEDGMKATELRDLDDDDLVEHIATERRELFGLRFQHATGELENTAGLRDAKRDLARALTVARERGIDVNTSSTTAEKTANGRRRADEHVEETTPGGEAPRRAEEAGRRAPRRRGRRPRRRLPSPQPSAAASRARGAPRRRAPEGRATAARRTEQRAPRSARRARARKAASSAAPTARKLDGAARAEATRARAERAEPTPPHEHGPGRQKVRQGVVVSDKADKTITVRIDVARHHRATTRSCARSTTLHAHDERNDAHEGDTVRVIESPAAVARQALAPGRGRWSVRK